MTTDGRSEDSVVEIFLSWGEMRVVDPGTCGSGGTRSHWSRYFTLSRVTEHSYVLYCAVSWTLEWRTVHGQRRTERVLYNRPPQSTILDCTCSLSPTYSSPYSWESIQDSDTVHETRVPVEHSHTSTTPLPLRFLWFILCTPTFRIRFKTGPRRSGRTTGSWPVLVRLLSRSGFYRSRETKGAIWGRPGASPVCLGMSPRVDRVGWDSE